MPWVQFDDQYPIGRSVAGLSDGAFRLHTSAFFWCARNGTDGLILREDLDLVCPRLRAPERFAAECVGRGVWHDATMDCGSGDCLAHAEADAWILHDFLAANPSGEESTARRSGRSSGGKLGNHRRWHASRGVTDPSCRWCTDSLSDRSSDRYTDQSADGEASRMRIPQSQSQSQSVVDVSNPVAGSNGRRRFDDLIIETIIKSIYERTSRAVDHDWATKIASEILTGRQPRNPAAYCHQTIMNDTNPASRFLPAY